MSWRSAALRCSNGARRLRAFAGGDSIRETFRANSPFGARKISHNCRGIDSAGTRVDCYELSGLDGHMALFLAIVRAADNRRLDDR
jgi:hypothetical protein